LELIKSKADSFTQEELHQHMQDFKFKAPDTDSEISGPLPFNLIFSIQIGQPSSSKDYFKPETAQSIFFSFKRLFEFNNDRLPFATAQIGLGFKNEISPRMGLIKVKEFTIAKIEHF
jgi:glycyl-tRNA synthetase